MSLTKNIFSLNVETFSIEISNAFHSAGSGGDQDAEPGARLTCHLLLRLFSANDLGSNSQSNGKTGGASIKSSTDKHLLAAAHQSITVGAVVAVLKSILMLGAYNHGL